VCERRLWKPATLFFWVSLGNWKEGLFYWVLWEREERLWNRSASNYGSFARGTRRDGFFNGTLKGMEGRLWKRTLLPVGAVFGKLEGPSFLGEFQRVREEGISLRRAPLGTWKGARLPRTFKDGRSLETERLFLLDLENWSVGSFTGNSDSYVKHVKESFRNPSLYRGCLRRTWREDSYPVDSERNVMEGSGNGAVLL